MGRAECTLFTSVLSRIHGYNSQNGSSFYQDWHLMTMQYPSLSCKGGAHLEKPTYLLILHQMYLLRHRIAYFKLSVVGYGLSGLGLPVLSQPCQSALYSIQSLIQSGSQRWASQEDVEAKAVVVAVQSLAGTQKKVRMRKLRSNRKAVWSLITPHSFRKRVFGCKERSRGCSHTLLFSHTLIKQHDAASYQSNVS